MTVEKKMKTIITFLILIVYFVFNRCFIVCTPQPPPIYALRDAFCRMGNLIDVYMLTNRNCGYAKYATKESAEEAIKVFFHHVQTVHMFLDQI